MDKKKIIRTATIPLSLKIFLNGSIEPLMEKYDLVLLASPNKELEELHKLYGVKTIGVSMERHISIFKDLKSLLQLILVFYKEKPYMVHSMTPKAGLLCMIAAWIARVPRRVHTFTGLVWPTTVGIKRNLLMLADKILCICATNIIPEGEGVKNDLEKHITRKPMKVLGYGNVRGVDMTFWQRPEITKGHNGAMEVAQLKNVLNLNGAFTFIFVGRLVGDKGVNELVDAFCKLYKKYSDARLLLVGPKEDGLDPLKPATYEKINNTVQITAVGPIFGEKILNYYAVSDCFVLPSYREGFPNTVLEAGAMGLPSIVTDVNGSREIIVDGMNGFIIPFRNADALFDAMERMMIDNVAREKMSKNARPMIEARFEQSFVRKCLFNYYEEIM